jgi:hypothetical protein
MNEVRSTNELSAVTRRARGQQDDRATSRSQRDNTSVFDGIRHALTLHDAYETAIE